MNLSASALAQLAGAAGFSGQDLVTAVAVCLAESSGKTDAYNPEGSYGLWQIYLPDHPEFSGVNLYDPATNAAAAFSIYSAAGGSFTPWSAFKNGAYARYMATAQSAVAALAGPSIDPGPGQVLPPDSSQPATLSVFNLSSIPTPLLIGALLVAGVFFLQDVFD